MGKWLGMAMGLGLAAALWLAWPRPEALPEPRDAACRAAQQAVKQRLKTVATAIFPPCREARIRQLTADDWRVEGRFDADFLFGENARTGYAATVRRRNGGFEIADLKIWP